MKARRYWALVGFLALLFLLLQKQLWWSSSSWFAVWRLDDQIAVLDKQNQKAEQRNQHIYQNVLALRSGKQAIEANARQQLGSVKQGEVFYQIKS